MGVHGYGDYRNGTLMYGVPKLLAGVDGVSTSGLVTQTSSKDESLRHHGFITRHTVDHHPESHCHSLRQPCSTGRACGSPLWRHETLSSREDATDMGNFGNVHCDVSNLSVGVTFLTLIIRLAAWRIFPSATKASGCGGWPVRGSQASKSVGRR